MLAAYRATGGAATAVYGPTPVLVQQIEQGAPADIFLSADPQWMDEAARRKLIRAGSRANIMANSLVLIGPKTDAPPQAIETAAPVEAALARGRIAMCDPERDPAGRFAKASLQALGVWPKVHDAIAIAENTLGAVILVDRGEAAAGVVFATDARGAKNVSIVGTFPAASHRPIVYPAAMTTGSKNADAQRLLAFLESPQAAAILQSYGYQPAQA